MSLTILLLCEAPILICLFFLARSIWLDKKKADLYHDFGEESLEWLPSYHSMLIKFWCWNIVKFVQDEDKPDGYFR